MESGEGERKKKPREKKKKSVVDPGNKYQLKLDDKGGGGLRGNGQSEGWLFKGLESILISRMVANQKM